MMPSPEKKPSPAYVADVVSKVFSQKTTSVSPEKLLNRLKVECIFYFIL